MAERFKLSPIPIQQFSLANGLRVVLCEDHAVPVVSVVLYYDVGSRNEKVGRTGFAHLFEHMMFQGSENVPKAGHFQYIFNSGGTMNGTTSTERTNYYETLPASHLPLALWLESDRMRSLKVTQENLDNQREAVKEEKRLRYDNQPYVNAFLRFNELVFKNPANAHSTIGSMKDLDAATIDDVREFFRIYYAPNNAVLTIVGDFEESEARELVEKYFSEIPSQPPPPPIDVTEPDEVAITNDTYYDTHAPTTAFMLGWKIPPRRTPEFYALSLGAELLFSGDSSRLYQKLVKGQELVVSITGGIDERRGPSALSIFALPKPGEEAAAIREQIVDEIRALKTSGPSAAEMEKLQNSLVNDVVRSRQSTMYRAQRLAEYALYDGDPTLFDSELEQYLAITPEQIRSAVERFLDVDNRVVLDIVPAAPDEETAGEDETAPAASALPPGEPKQPAAPPAQVPSVPPAQPPAGAEPVVGASNGSQVEPPQQPADPPKQPKASSGPLHT